MEIDRCKVPPVFEPSGSPPLCQKETVFRQKALIAAIVATATQWMPLATVADELECSDPLLSVESKTNADGLRVCEAAVKAKSFLANCGIEQTQPVTIELRDKIVGVSDHCAGVYFPGTNHVALVAPSLVSGMMPLDSAFSTLEADVFFDSLLVHELAHAFTEQRNANALKCSADSEYIAYALQIESLPHSDRETVLSFREVKRPVPEQKLNDFVLGFSPDMFGVLAWSHFSSPDNGCRFINELINGNVTLALPDLE